MIQTIQIIRMAIKMKRMKINHFSSRMVCWPSSFLCFCSHSLAFLNKRREEKRKERRREEKRREEKRREINKRLNFL